MVDTTGLPGSSPGMVYAANASVPPTVGSGTPNYWGVHDLHGVIWEWVADFQTMLVTGESRGDSDVERNLFCGAE